MRRVWQPGQQWILSMLAQFPHTHTHKVTSTFLPSRILNWHKCRVAILIYCTYRCDTFHSSEECFQCASVELGNFGNTYSATSKLEVIPRVQHLLPQVLSFTCSHKLEEFSLFVQKVMEAGGFWSDILHLHRSMVRRRCSFPVHQRRHVAVLRFRQNNNSIEICQLISTKRTVRT